MASLNLDLAVLRSFVLIAEGRSFAGTADLVGRSSSAVSLQIQRLENDLGVQVLRRNNRGVVLTLAGEKLLGFARRLIRLNDEAAAAFRPGEAVARPLRFGTTQDFAETVLPKILQRLAREHPNAELTLRVDRSSALIEAVHTGSVDVVVAIRRDDPLHREILTEVPMIWIGRDGSAVEPERTLPMVLFETPCTFRSAALDALAAAGRSCRIAFTSPSLSGLRSAVEAGLGVTVRTRHMLAPGLSDVGSSFLLPALPPVAFSLYAGSREGSWPMRDDLIDLCRRAFREQA